MYGTLNAHRNMVFDARRNAAYHAALKAVITPATVVMDLGAGVGLHGLMAAQLGARRVYLIEPEDIVTLAEQIATDNGLAERIVALNGSVEAATLPEKVDVIVSVFTGNFLLSEDLLPSLFYARDHHLKHGGRLIPDQATMWAAPISAAKLFHKRVGRWSEAQFDVDLGRARSLAANHVYFEGKWDDDYCYLAPPAAIESMDLMTATTTDCRVNVQFTVTEAGICHGLAGWFDMRLGDEWLSTAPHAPALHWSAAFLPLDPPLSLKVGDQLTAKITRLPYDEWHWQVEAGGERRRHSSFLGRVLSPARWRLASDEGRPYLGEAGAIEHFILSRFDGHQTLAAIAAQVRKAWPALAWSEAQTLRRVSQLARRFGRLTPAGDPHE